MRTILTHRAAFLDYIEVLKPRETSLLTFIGLSSGIIAAKDWLPTDLFILSLGAIGLGSAGCNGLTNYLDREADSKMQRTRSRALPSLRINPPEKVLPWVVSLLGIALALAWVINPVCFIFGVVGVAASSLWRKTVACTFLGIIAGCIPVLIGWFAAKPIFDRDILLLCLLVAIWIPIHVWSVMIANRDDYLKAGLSYFPLSWKVRNVAVILLILSFFLYFISLLLYWVINPSLVYLITANILGILMVLANVRLLFSFTEKVAWQVYKLSAFPYLGLIFLTLSLDILIFA